MVGQEFVVTSLRNALTGGQLRAHAYLFSGPRGVGKTSAARVLARSLNCEHGPTATPCGTCGPCTELARGALLDVIEIDGASNTGVDDVRAIRDEVLFPPATARFKIYIIDEVHMLSNSAFNALLKTIEEPPPYVVFIFATTEIHKVPATIRSRCQQFTFRLFSIDELREALTAVASEQDVTADSEALTWIAKEAEGSLRDAYTTFDQVVSLTAGQVTLREIRDKVGTLALDDLNLIGAGFAAGDSAALLELADAALTRGVSVERFVVALSDYVRSLLFLKHGIDRASILGYAVESFDRSVVDRLSVQQLETATELLLELYRNLKLSVNPRLELELVLSRVARAGGLMTPEELVSEIRSLRRSLSESGVSVAPPVPAPAVAQAQGLAVVADRDAGADAPDDRATAAAGGGAAGGMESSEGDSADLAVDPAARATEGAEELVRMVEAVREQRLLSLAASLGQARSLQAARDEVTLTFADRYAGEYVVGEQAEIARAAAKVFGRTLAVRVAYSTEQEQQAAASEADSAVDRVRRVFRGEVVKEIPDG